MPMLDRLGGLVYRRSWLVVAVAGVVVAIAGVLSVGVFGKLKVGGYLDPRAESSVAASRIDAEFGGQYNLLFLVTPDAGSVDTPQVAAAGTRLTEELAGEKSLSNVSSYWTVHNPALRAPDGSSALIVMHVAGDEDTALKNTENIYGRYHSPGGGLTVRVGGQQGVSRDIFHNLRHSLTVAESIAIPVSLALLVVAFGSVVAAALPLVIGSLAIIGTFGEM